jgi:hypothetical protein
MERESTWKSVDGPVGEATDRLPRVPGWMWGPAALAIAIGKADQRTYRTWMFALAVVAAGLFVGLGQLDRILVELDYPEGVGGGIASLQDADSVGNWGESVTAGSQADVEDAVAAAGIHDTPRTIAITYVVLDFALVVAYTTLLALVALRLASMLRDRARWERALRFVLATSLLLTAPLAAVDVLENVAQLLALMRVSPGSSLLLLTALKWLLLAVVVLGLTVATARLVRDCWNQTTRKVLRTAAVLRFQILAVALFALLLLGPGAAPQSADAILRWGVSDGWELVAVAVALTLLLAIALFVTARNSALVSEEVNRPPLRPRILGAVGLALIAIAALLGFFDDGEGAGLLVLGVLLAGIAALSAPKLLEDTTRAARTGETAEARGATALLPALLAAAAPLLLGLAVVTATVGQLALFGIPSQLDWAGVATVGIGLLAVSVVVFNRALAAGAQAGPVGAGGIAVAGVAAALLAGAIFADPWGAAALTGAVGVVAAFLIVLAIGGWAVARVERRWSPPAALTLVGFHRLPVLTLLVAATLGTMLLDDVGDHEIRTIPAAAADGREPAHVTADEALQRWLRVNRATQRDVTPLVFVAASGGGVRAAYWTARVLRCALEAQSPPSHCAADKDGRVAPAGGIEQALFVASGVSGGSLGLTTYAAQLNTTAASGEPAGEPTAPTGGDWVRDRLGDDFLAPTVAWMLFSDVPKAITGLRWGGDRASVLERAWERSWTDGDEDPGGGPLTAGLRASWTANQRMPLMVLNGTDVSRACRVSTSVLDADVEDRDELSGDNPVTADCQSQESFVGPTTGERAEMANWALPATHDLVDQLDCEDGNPRDVRLSTAALLSARFPYVSPSGRIALCSEEEAIDVVDGGYVENSGSSTALEIWQRVAPAVDEFNAAHPDSCVAPVFIQIDNDYVRDRNPGASRPDRPIEPLVPPRVFTRVRHGNAANARQATALAFAARGKARGRRLWLDMGKEKDKPVDRYVHIYPSFHPGTKAPLGWALSAPSMQSLDDQLGAQSRNSRAVTTIRRWFDERATCKPPKDD